MRQGTDRQTDGRDHYTFHLGYTSKQKLKPAVSVVTTEYSTKPGTIQVS